MNLSGPMTVTIPTGADVVQADLTLPETAKGAVIFAHGSGSSRHSPRNKYVAEILNQARLATLLIYLLTPDEEIVDIGTAEYRFNIGLLSRRLIDATDWTLRDSRLANMPLGYFGASTGAAAALAAAAQRSELIAAVVSRGGRPDLAGDALGRVAAPTLMMVGEFDRDVLELNREAARRMQARTEIKVVPGATHLFEEEGALEQAASLARQWFESHLIQRRVA